MNIDPIELLTRISDVVMVSRLEGSTREPTIEWVNPSFENLFGLRSEDLRGLHLADLSAPGTDERRHWEQVGELLGGDTPARVVVHCPVPGGDWIPMDMSLDVLPSDGLDPRVIAICRPVQWLDLDDEVSIEPERAARREGRAITRDTFLSDEDLHEIAVVCASCSRLRTASGGFKQPVDLLRDELSLEVSHGLCEACYSHFDL